MIIGSLIALSCFMHAQMCKMLSVKCNRLYLDCLCYPGHACMCKCTVYSVRLVYVGLNTLLRFFWANFIQFQIHFSLNVPRSTFKTRTAKNIYPPLVSFGRKDNLSSFPCNLVLSSRQSIIIRL